MDFQTLAKNRWSVRKFKTDALPDDVLGQILSAGQSAPTACNLQPQRVFVIRSAEAMDKVKKCTRCHFNAPVVLLVCCDHTASWKRKYDGADSGVVDASIVTTHMMLAAEELGVGSCWVMHFNPAVLRSELNLSDALEPVALLPMGYPADDAEPIAMHFQRKTLDELVTEL